VEFHDVRLGHHTALVSTSETKMAPVDAMCPLLTCEDK
jgi:hypothetical protein